MSTDCAICRKVGRAMVRDCPGGVVLWSCTSAECRAEALVRAVERDGQNESDRVARARAEVSR